MVYLAVKPKVGVFDPSKTPLKILTGWLVILASLLTFIFSLLPLPSATVEQWFSLRVFPIISAGFGFISNAIGAAWFDILLAVAILYICVCIRRRRWMAIAVTIATAYLVFFWSWGLNYHRQ